MQIKKSELVNYLLDLTRSRSLTELAGKLGVSRVTLNNWNRENIEKLSPESLEKLRDLFDKNSKWGVSLGKITNSSIEIITSGRDSSHSQNKSDDDFLLKETLRENFQLKKEISILKEKLEKYEVKK